MKNIRFAIEYKNILGEWYQSVEIYKTRSDAEKAVKAGREYRIIETEPYPVW